jgi:hypothetical protein
MTTYHVYQSFETVGDPCLVKCSTREEAEREAETFRAGIAKWVAGLPVDYDPYIAVGYVNECAAWDKARDLACGAAEYGMPAGEFIADAAVCIEEIDAEEVSDGQAS